MSRRTTSANSTSSGGDAQPGRRFRAWARRWLVAVAWVLVLCASDIVAGRDLENPDRVKAAFLRNFARYVAWPTNMPPDSRSWNIGVLGDDSFGNLVDTTLRGRTEQDRPFNVFRADNPGDLPPCHIVYIAYKDPVKRRAALEALKNLPVLTVGDAPEFMQEGGIIRFQVRERVEMSVNLDQARAVSLRVQSKMLEVSREVLENGALRKLR